MLGTVWCGIACLNNQYRMTAYVVAGLIVLSLGARVRNGAVLAGALGFVVAVRFLFHGYGLFLATFIPTVAHVYLFTLLFLISGIARSRQRPLLSWINAALLLMIPVGLALMSAKLRIHALTPGRYWMDSETFAPVHVYLAGLFGVGMYFDPSRALEPHALAAFRVLAFIYLHHYLNWFAKTELLEWHHLSRRSWALVLGLYAAALASYAYRFALGFYVAYFLSLLHVLLELPLNWHTGAALVSGPWKRLRTAIAPIQSAAEIV